MGISASEICYAMSLIRQVLEIEDIYSEFPLLALYCNWCLHVKLDKSRAKVFLENVFSSFVRAESDSKSMGSKKAFYISLKMSEQLSANKLKKEFINLFKKIDVPIGGFEDLENWHGFFSGILKILLGNVIVIQDVKAVFEERVDLYEEALRTLGIRDRIQTINFWIEKNIDGDAIWYFQLDATIIYKGNLFNPEKIPQDLKIITLSDNTCRIHGVSATLRRKTSAGV